MALVNKILGGVFALLLLTGCEDRMEVKEIQKAEVTETSKDIDSKKEIITESSKEEKEVIAKEDNLNSSVFKDSAKISTKGVYSIMIFGSEGCKYCTKLKNDIKNSEDLQNRLKTTFPTYYLSATNQKVHKLEHNGEFMDVDTKTLIDIYQIKGSPTIIFNDKNGKSIIVVPGYMPTKQFLVTLDFIESKKWENKDRKNGEVYQALKDFYIEKDIIKEDKK